MNLSPEKKTLRSYSRSSFGQSGSKPAAKPQNTISNRAARRCDTAASGDTRVNGSAPAAKRACTLPAAHKGNNLNSVARLKPPPPVLGLGNDLPVKFNGHRTFGDADLGQQFGDRNPAGQQVRLAVQFDGKRFACHGRHPLGGATTARNRTISSGTSVFFTGAPVARTPGSHGKP